jgi:hypothetical protein
VSILTLSGLVEALATRSGGDSAVSEAELAALRAYRARYGVA